LKESASGALSKFVKGEVFDDEWTRKINSVDASQYVLSPSIVLHPDDEHDLQGISSFCHKRSLPITARGAGTGLLGQSLTNGIVIDFTKHMNKILQIEDDYVIVQPGVVKGVLDKELRKRGKFLPPDPASSNYCTLGGMIANNSSGPHGLAYGSVINFLKAVKVVHSDGTIDTYDESDHGSKYATQLIGLVSDNINLIHNGYPLVSKNSCGYRLDAVIGANHYSPQKVFAASEGTLGLVASASIRVLDIPTHRSLLILAFEDPIAAATSVPTLLKFHPVAAELLDSSLYSRESDEVSRSHDTESIVFVEFAADSLREVESKLSTCKAKIASSCTSVETASDQVSIDRTWAARKGQLNNIMKLTVGSRRPVGLIEDTVVNTNFLPEYVRFLLNLYHENNLNYVIYGHLGNGNLHTRPLMDLESPSELELLESLADRVFAKVIQQRGTISGEHGDGLARIDFIPNVYGGTIFSLFKKVKKLFDPTYLLNPGKKIPLSAQSVINFI
jgi:glycolate dehydrogenase FAD-linked subunit